MAEYNIACCYAAMSDTPRAIDTVRGYLESVGEPLNQARDGRGAGRPPAERARAAP